MILGAMNNGNSRGSTHETIDNHVTIRHHPSQPQRLVQHSNKNSHRLGPADQRVFKLGRMHFHAEKWAHYTISVADRSIDGTTRKRGNGEKKATLASARAASRGGSS